MIDCQRGIKLKTEKRNTEKEKKNEKQKIKRL